MKGRARDLLLLPVGYYAALVVCAVAALAFNSCGAKFGEGSPGLPDEPGSASRACKLVRALPRPIGSSSDVACDWLCADGVSACKRQLTNRNDGVKSSRKELEVACRRHAVFREDLKRNRFWARSSLREEESEVRRVYRRIRQLVGPVVEDEARANSGRLLVTFLVGFLALCGFGAHARSVGIPRSSNVAVLRPLGAIGAVTLAGATVVIAWESLDVGKTSFDWSSYCVSGAAFWAYHFTIFPVSVATAIQLAAGWYATSARFVPPLITDEPRWGVGPYVRFLEIWCYLVVLLVAAISAYWFHELAKDPESRTNVVVSMVGIGAFFAVAALILRFLRNAIRLRAAYETLTVQYRRPGPARTRRQAPPDPTEGLLGKSLWQLPGVFSAAWALAYVLLEWGGAGRLIGGSP